jgi:hypothetical protein
MSAWTSKPKRDRTQNKKSREKKSIEQGSNEREKLVEKGTKRK